MGIYLSIDPGYKNTAYAVLKTNKENNYIDCIDYHVIKTIDDLSPLFIIDKVLDRILSRYKPIISIAIESIFFGFNVGHAINTAKVIGIVELMASQNKIPYYEVDPKHLKKTITGNGNAKKEDMKVAVLKQLDNYPDELNNLPKTKLNHIIDAIGVGIWNIKKHRTPLE